jgi:hypothetical protein
VLLKENWLNKKLSMYKINIDRDVHLNWSGGHDSLFWLSQKPLFHLAPWAPWLHSHARRGSKSSDKVLYSLLERVRNLYENNFKMPFKYIKALHYI